MSDPIVLLAKQRIVKASADLEVELSERNGGGPAVEMLRRLRDRAADSLAKLPFLNVYDPKDRIAIVTLQNEVKRYDEWVVWMREIIIEGQVLDQEMQESERAELLDVLMEKGDEQQARDLGLLGPDAQDT
jgi:hypothetical protein